MGSSPERWNPRIGEEEVFESRERPEKERQVEGGGGEDLSLYLTAISEPASQVSESNRG